MSLHGIYHYKLAEAFPVGSEATFGQIARRSGLNEPDLRRILRHAMAHRIFREVREGVVAHTASSRILAEDMQMQAWTGVAVEEMWPAAVQVCRTATTLCLSKEVKLNIPAHRQFRQWLNGQTHKSLLIQ